MGTKKKQTREEEPPKEETPLNPGCFLAKAFYADREDLKARVPELHPLSQKTIAVVGLGTLGAPSVLEFARGGMGCIRMVDHDVVDPATSVRWPFGFGVSGRKKGAVLQDFIQHNYPYTSTQWLDQRLGSVRRLTADKSSHLEQLEGVLDSVDLIYDATAELGVNHFLADYAWQERTPYIGIDATLGGWGGSAFRIQWKDTGGCWMCYRLACAQNGGIPEPPSAPSEDGNVQPVGCADPTFTGAGFDMLQIAAAGVRLAVSTLCAGAQGAYPPVTWDVVHIALRDNNGGVIPPEFRVYEIKAHPDCKRCSGH